MPVRCASVQSPCASANAEGAKGEHEANAAATRHSSVRGANAKRARREPQANAARAKAVCRPESVPRSHVASVWVVRSPSVIGPWVARCPPVRRLFAARVKSGARPYLSVARTSGARMKSVIFPPFNLSGRNERQRMESAQSAARRKLIATRPFPCPDVDAPPSTIPRKRRAARKPPAATEGARVRECNPLRNRAPPSATALISRRQSPSPAKRCDPRRRCGASP